MLPKSFNKKYLLDKNIKVDTSKDKNCYNFTSHFTYFPLILMYHSRGLKHKIIMVNLFFNIHMCDCFLCHCEPNTINYLGFDPLPSSQGGHNHQNSKCSFFPEILVFLQLFLSKKHIILEL